MKKHIPNILTISRIISAVVGSFLLLNDKFDLAIIVLICGAATDFFDGKLARKFNAQSVLGYKLDQLSDKLFTFAIGTVLVILGNKFLLISIIIEFIFSIIISYLTYKTKKWGESKKEGKIKIALMFFMITLAILLIKFDILLIPFIIVWIITLLVQLYANIKMIIDKRKTKRKE